ncbi:MAG TPA: cell division protein ZapB [Bryobacteraceae bacterium]|nr:cell division protein ZapB [Bryobacteraceae bacterium]
MESAVQPAEGSPSELEALASLEERIRRMAELVASLRAQRDSALAELNAARQIAAPAIDEARKLRAELDGLRSERVQVRKRIEKLLGQMDSLSGS